MSDLPKCGSFAEGRHGREAKLRGLKINIRTAACPMFGDESRKALLGKQQLKWHYVP
jgi:hypothetical protein